MIKRNENYINQRTAFSQCITGLVQGIGQGGQGFLGEECGGQGDEGAIGVGGALEESTTGKSKGWVSGGENPSNVK